MKKSIQLILVLIVIGMITILAGCGTGDSQIKPDGFFPSDPGQAQPVQRTASEDQPVPPSLESILPLPVTASQAIKLFTRDGIEAFYSLNKRVPVSFDEYIESGIPLLIPNDYVTGRKYKLQSELDLSDTTGFTFKSDGLDSCSFEFVINNNKTSQNQSYLVDFTNADFADYIVADGKSGFLSGVDYYFDQVKREYCMKFFTYYSFIYVNQNSGKAATSLKDLMKSQGTPIEKGWKWIPELGSNEYFEFGIDPVKERIYCVQGSRKMEDGRPSVIHIQQLHEGYRVNYEPQEGIDEWHFTSDDFIPPDVIEMKKFISSRTFYNGYEELIAE